MMQDMATFFEDGIREHPYDWLMLQKVFVDDLDPDRQDAAGHGRPPTASWPAGLPGQDLR